MAGTGVSREQGGVRSVMKDRENPRNTLQERREQELASDRGKWDSCVEQVRSRVFSGVRRGCTHVVMAARTHSPLHTAGAKPGRQERTGRVEGIGQDRTGWGGESRTGQDVVEGAGQDRTPRASRVPAARSSAQHTGTRAHPCLRMPRSTCPGLENAWAQVPQSSLPSPGSGRCTCSQPGTS